MHLYRSYRNSNLVKTRKSLQWRHNERDGWNHRCLDCLLNRLFRRRSKKTSKLRVTGYYGEIVPVTGELPAQRASNTGNASIWWRHHVLKRCIQHHPCQWLGSIRPQFMKSQETDPYCTVFPWQAFVFHWIFLPPIEYCPKIRSFYIYCFVQIRFSVIFPHFFAIAMPGRQYILLNFPLGFLLWYSQKYIFCYHKSLVFGIIHMCNRSLSPNEFFTKWDLLICSQTGRISRLQIQAYACFCAMLIFILMDFNLMNSVIIFHAILQYTLACSSGEAMDLFVVYLHTCIKIIQGRQ